MGTMLFRFFNFNFQFIYVMGLRVGNLFIEVIVF